MEINLNAVERFFRSRLQHYNEKKYWKYRSKIVNYAKERSIFKLFLLFKLLYIKKCDAFNNASFGTHLGFGAIFGTIPHLPHGLYGIIISHNAVIGKNVTIYHQVTIGEGKGGAPEIGDNVLIGAGAKIIRKVKIGNNVRIGAGAVVFSDIPDGATVACQPPKIILRN